MNTPVDNLLRKTAVLSIGIFNIDAISFFELSYGILIAKSGRYWIMIGHILFLSKPIKRLLIADFLFLLMIVRFELSGMNEI